MPIEKMAGVVVEDDVISSIMSLLTDNTPILGAYVLLRREVNERHDKGLSGEDAIPTADEIADICNINQYAVVRLLCGLCLVGLLSRKEYDRLVPDFPFEEEAKTLTDSEQDIASCQ